MQAIYFDNNATTQVDEAVVQAMLPYFTTHYGNASSSAHSFGWIAEQAVETAQEQVANLIGAQAQEIIFTSGATESINMIIKGLFAKNKHKKSHIITAATEHSAVLKTLESLSNQALELTILPVNRFGQIDLDDLKAALQVNTLLVCLMYANNETGTMFPAKEIAALAHQNNTLFFCDATQAVGKVDINVNDDGIDLLCLSAHKMHGPKGVGALYIKKMKPALALEPLLNGGMQQAALRAGTLNVPGIVGLGEACKLAQNQLWETSVNTSRLRTFLEQQLTVLPDVFINGDTRHRLPNTTNICFSGKSASAIIKYLKNVAVSTGSACNSASNEPSHVLIAMGLTANEAQSSIRFSISKYNTMQEVEYVVNAISAYYSL